MHFSSAIIARANQADVSGLSISALAFVGALSALLHLCTLYSLGLIKMRTPPQIAAHFFLFPPRSKVELLSEKNTLHFRIISSRSRAQN